MSLFAELSIIIAVATALAVVMRILKQPLIIGHILTGLIVGPFVLGIVTSTETLALLSEFGVAILLFTVGLHLSPDVIRQFGRVSAVTACGQVALISAAGFVAALFLGFPLITSFYIGIALSFSSTIIIMKLIADKGDLDVLYARILVGFLLVQDLIAALLLLGIPLLSDPSPSDIARFVGAGLGLLIFIYFASRFFISKVSEFIEKSQEFLFLFAMMWGIGIAALFQQLGFSLESGALIAGVSLATMPARREISARLSPLRDFFIIIFFILLGTQLQLADVRTMMPAAVVLSTIVLIGNPLIIMTIMGRLGYKKKTGFQMGTTVGQISEFSLILVALGVALGHISASTLSLLTLVGLLTIFISTYLVQHSARLYRMFAPYIRAFEVEEVHEPHAHRFRPHIVLFGCNRIGYDFLESLLTLDKKIMVVDYNPEMVAVLKEAGVPIEFGDASDIAFLESIDLSEIEIAISTIPDADTNLLIHRIVKAKNADAIVMVVAHRLGEALSHYDEGIDYVIVPHLLGSKHAAEMVLKLKNDKKKYGVARDEHVEQLQLRIAIGHDAHVK